MNEKESLTRPLIITTRMELYLTVKVRNKKINENALFLCVVKLNLCDKLTNFFFEPVTYLELFFLKFNVK